MPHLSLFTSEMAQWLGVPHGQSGHMWKIVPPPGFDPQTMQPVASSYTNFAIPATLVNVRIFFCGATAPSGPGPPHYQGFTITLRHTTLHMTPLDEWSAWCIDLHMITHNTQTRQTFIFPVGFEPTIPASEQPQTHALDRVATRMGNILEYFDTSKKDGVRPLLFPISLTTLGSNLRKPSNQIC
jgi:hypothetical protein